MSRVDKFDRLPQLFERFDIECPALRVFFGLEQRVRDKRYRSDTPGRISHPQ